MPARISLAIVYGRATVNLGNYGYLSAGNRVAALELLATLFDMGALEEEEDDEPSDEPIEVKDEKPRHFCPYCEQGIMVSVQEFPRPTVHQIMQMRLEQIQQPRLPFM